MTVTPSFVDRVLVSQMGVITVPAGLARTTKVELWCWPRLRPEEEKW